MSEMPAGNTAYDIAITDEQDAVAVDSEQLRTTVMHVLRSSGVDRASVSVAVVDNAAIRELKKRYFDIDMETDVISFDLADGEQGDDTVDCEIVVSAQRAKEMAGNAESVAGELNLYVVHGLLHQLGYDDQTEAQAEQMHQREDVLLEELGFGPVYSRKG